MWNDAYRVGCQSEHTVTTVRDEVDADAWPDSD